jgi:hypothetical protein
VILGRGTFAVRFTAWSRDLRVTAVRVVSHVGSVLLRMLADRSGLTEALSGAVAAPPPTRNDEVKRADPTSHPRE